MKVELSKKKKKKLEEQYYQLHKLRIAVSLEQVRRRKIWKKKKRKPIGSDFSFGSLRIKTMVCINHLSKANVLLLR